MQLRYTGRGAELWVEVRYSQGRFFRRGDTSIWQLMHDIISGEVILRDEPTRTSTRDGRSQVRRRRKS